jgi:HEAT repeat protein
MSSRKRATVVSATVALAAVAVIALLRASNGRRRLPPTITDPAMITIRTMVGRGDLWGAVARLGTSYRFNGSVGLNALRQFSVLVLRDGLNEYDPYERCYAEGALAVAGDRTEIPLLVRTFQRAGTPSLKMAVADGLGDIGDADAVTALQDLYRTTDNGSRRTIVQGLAEAYDRSAIQSLKDALNSDDEMTRLTAAQGLGRLGNPRVIPVLRQMLASARGAYEKVIVADSLLRLGDSSAVETAESILRDHVDDNARAMAAVTLAYARDARVVALLRRALNDHNIDVRLGAAVALTHYADPLGSRNLLAFVRDEDPVTRLHLGQLLDEIEFHNGREVLLAALASPDSNLSVRAIHAIGLLGGQRDTGLLSRFAEEDDDSLRRAEVAWALGRIGTADVIEPLMALVADSDRSVRYTAADALDRAAMCLLGLGSERNG